MNLSKRARRLLSPLKRLGGKRFDTTLLGPYSCVVEVMSDQGVIQGWIFETETGSGHVGVGVFAGDEMLLATRAHQGRNDVRGVYGCSAFCGFRFELTGAQMQKVISQGGVLQVRTTEGEPRVLKTSHFKIDATDPSIGKSGITNCLRVLEEDLSTLVTLLDDVPADIEVPSALEPHEFRQHGAIFSTDPIIPDVPQNDHPAYLDYTRFRLRLDEGFDVQSGLEVGDRFLYWYFTGYRSQSKLRVPFSNAHIEYLNAPMVMGSNQYTLSRAIWWRLAGRSDMMGTLNLNDRDCYLNILFWWAHQDLPDLYFEDCLMPDRFIDKLSGIHPSRAVDAYPLSYFTERYFIHAPQLHFLDMGKVEDRKTLVLAMMVHAANRPDLLRYIPRRSINQLLAEDENGVCDLERFVNDMLEFAKPIGGEAEEPVEYVRLTRARYVEALRKQYFDLESFEFMTRSASGDRFQAAAMALPTADQEDVDVQLIGPLAKASGLGQATRLSADILRATGLKVRGVDFDLDNPAPEGYSTDSLIEDIGPAKVNIIHLNAESTPSAFSFLPDVFSNAYNIGYFFWELDKPANCHYLGMELLDEIWVSTEYGVSIYEPDAKSKPVTNVGMCYEETPDISRDTGRAYVEKRFRFSKENFVCLVAFDSFSFIQRKNPINVLRAFQKAFEGVPNARLIVKTQNRDSVFDPAQMHLWDQVDVIINKDKRIVIMNETLSYKDLLRLKAGSDCYISLHKSEGWGFGMIEAMNLGVPVVCTAYSGNMDFCSDETAWLVDYDEPILKPEDYIFVRRGAKWAEPRLEHAAQQLRAAFENPEERQRRAAAAKAHITENFSTGAIAKRYGSRLETILQELKE